MALMTCSDCATPHSDAAPACPRCGRPNVASVVAPPMAQLRKAVSSFGVGGLVQIVGTILFLPSLFVIGTAFLAGGGALGAAGPLATILCGPGLLGGVFLWVWGRRLCTRWLCGACGVQLSGDEVRLCPSCKAPLEYDAR